MTLALRFCRWESANLIIRVAASEVFLNHFSLPSLSMILSLCHSSLLWNEELGPICSQEIGSQSAQCFPLGLWGGRKLKQIVNTHGLQIEPSMMLLSSDDQALINRIMQWRIVISMEMMFLVRPDIVKHGKSRIELANNFLLQSMLLTY